MGCHRAVWATGKGKAENGNLQLLDRDLEAPDLGKIVPKMRVEFEETPSGERHLGFIPISPYEQAISTWLERNYGIKIKTDAVSHISPSPKSKDLYTSPRQEDSELCHEATHKWLILKKRFLENGGSPKYRALDKKLNPIIEIAYTMEPGQKALVDRHLEAGPPRPATIECPIKNLVSESKTLGKREGEGHPMDNFHEFFASSVATFTFDGEKFFELLGKLKALSERPDCPRIKKLYDKVMDLLGDVHKLATELYQEQKYYLDQYRGIGKTSRERVNLESNLEKLGALLTENKRGPERERLLH